MAQVRLEEITKIFGVGDDAVRAVDDVTIDVADHEFMILLGSFDAWRTWTETPAMFGAVNPKVIAAIAATGVILGAVYMLWMFQKVMFGENKNPKNKHLPDLSVREVCVFVPMLVMAFWLGLRPSTFLAHIDPGVSHMLSDFREKYADGLVEKK